MVTKLLFTLGAHLVIPTNPERLMNIDKSNDLIENVAFFSNVGYLFYIKNNEY